MDTQWWMGVVNRRHGDGVAAAYADGHAKWVGLTGSFGNAMVAIPGWGASYDSEYQAAWDALDDQ